MSHVVLRYSCLVINNKLIYLCVVYIVPDLNKLMITI